MIQNNPLYGRTLVIQRSMRARRTLGVSKPWPGANLVTGTFTHPVPFFNGRWTLANGTLRTYNWPIPNYLTTWQPWFNSMFPVSPRLYQDGFGGYFFNATMRANFVITS